MASLVWCAESDICKTNISSHHILIPPFPPHQFPHLPSPSDQVWWTYSSLSLNSIRFFSEDSEDNSRQLNTQPDAFDYTKLICEELQINQHSHLPHTENTV